MIRIVLPIILTIICLAGCTMAPTYSRPAPPVPTEWPKGPAYGENVETQAGPHAGDIGWRRFYEDERLRKVIDLALKNNRDLRVAILNIEKARALYRIQRAELFPALTAAGSLIEQRIPADIAQSGEAYDSKQYNVNAGVIAWEIDFFGRVRSLTDRALEQYLATEQASRSTQISLVAEVANAYLTLAADGEGLRLAQSTLETYETTYKLIQRRAEVGASSDLDLYQIRTRVEAAKVEIARYTNLVAREENALNLLVGSTVPSGLLPGNLNTITEPKDISPGLSSEVLLNRPDILQAEHQLKAANATIGAARAAFFPNIILTTNIGTTSDALGRLFKAGSSAWTFMPQVTMPIFDARVWAAADAVKIEKEIVLAQYEKTIQTAFREVADALARRGTIDDQIAAQESLVKAWEETYRLYNARYTKGIDGYLGVLEAQRSLFATQQILIATHLLRLTNRVTLYKVLGGGTGE
jgi:multidrug efflux system outer membrane protein